MSTQSEKVNILKNAVDTRDLKELVYRCLPEQGAVEVQNDVPGKEHAWHVHDTDETLIILEGSVRFYWTDNEAVCTSGDVIVLPRHARHGSVALEDGAKYIIAFNHISI
ncbi:MAG: cupin domain-containing protein [Rhodobacter sp.]|nr:cupin domain-containing protein [Rhodobacter sp.]